MWCGFTRSFAQFLAPIFADTRCLKVGQNLKYDMLIMRNAGMPVGEPLFDTMIASFVLDSTRRSHGMDSLVSGLLGHTMIPKVARDVKALLLSSLRDTLQRSPYFLQWD